MQGKAPAGPPEEDPTPRGRRGRARGAPGPQGRKNRGRGPPGTRRLEGGPAAPAQRRGGSTECGENDSRRVLPPPPGPARPSRRAIGSGAARRGGERGGPGMIHLECGSGWCAAQGTPVRDCGEAWSPACLPNPARSGPKGSRHPPSIPTSCPRARVPLAEGRPDALPPQRPLSPELAEVCVAWRAWKSDPGRGEGRCVGSWDAPWGHWTDLRSLPAGRCSRLTCLRGLTQTQGRRAGMGTRGLQVLTRPPSASSAASQVSGHRGRCRWEQRLSVPRGGAGEPPPDPFSSPPPPTATVAP